MAHFHMIHLMSSNKTFEAAFLCIINKQMWTFKHQTLSEAKTSSNGSSNSTQSLAQPQKRALNSFKRCRSFHTWNFQLGPSWNHVGKQLFCHLIANKTSQLMERNLLSLSQTRWHNLRSPPKLQIKFVDCVNYSALFLSFRAKRNKRKLKKFVISPGRASIRYSSNLMKHAMIIFWNNPSIKMVCEQKMPVCIISNKCDQ